MAKKTEKVEPVRAHCPKCDGDRVCDLHGSTKTTWDWEDRQGNSMNGGASHSLLQCRGCETVFYQVSSYDSESIDHWYDYNGEVQSDYDRTITTYPKPDSKTQPPWMASLSRIDQQLSDILDEVYLAHDNRSRVLTVVGLRTALDRATELLGIDPAKSFAQKLAALRDGGWIGDTEHDILEVVVDSGSAAAHRGWKPSSSETLELMTAMEVFLQKAFIVEKKALKLKAKIPAKPTRQKKPKPAALPAPKPAAKTPPAEPA